MKLVAILLILGNVVLGMLAPVPLWMKAGLVVISLAAIVSVWKEMNLAQRAPWLLWVVVVVQVYAATWTAGQDFAVWKKVWVVVATTVFALAMILREVKRQRQP